MASSHSSEGQPGNDPNWRKYLRGNSPRQILHRIWEGDPLRVGDRCERRLLDVAYLIDIDRLFHRAIARVAYAAALGYNGTPSLSQWLVDRINESIEELLQEDVASELSGLPPDAEEEDYYSFLADAVEVEPVVARRMTIAFNGLAERQRRPFYQIAVLGESLDDYADAHDIPRDQLKASIQETMSFILLAQKADPDEEDPWLL